MKLLRINEMRDVPSLFMFLIGNVGMLLGTWVLKGDLDHRYPFKVMNVPPPNYYVEVSNYLSIFVVVITLSATFAAVFWMKVKGTVAGFGSLLVGPLLFCTGLWVLTAIGPYSGELNLPLNYDASTATQRHHEFYIGAVELSFVSLIFYGVAYAGMKVIFLIAYRRRFLR